MDYPIPALVFYGSYLVFPFIIGLLLFSYHKKKVKWITGILFILCLVFIYARFIERYWIVVHHEIFTFPKLEANTQKPTSVQKFTTIRSAIISDLHLGLYKDRDFLEEIVKKINEQKPDMVLIPGDFTYKITREQFSFFEPLKKINAPIYAVAGNHDSKRPGEFSSKEVRDFIMPFNVNFIDNTEAKIIFGPDKSGLNLKIFGLSDLWEKKMDFSAINTIQRNDNAIILAHNPDTAYALNNTKADLLITGHTHGGQIRIPFLYKIVIPTIYDFDRGWYDVNKLKVFVTSGVGEIGLPMRFLVPPEIVVLDMKFPL